MPNRNKLDIDTKWEADVTGVQLRADLMLTIVNQGAQTIWLEPHDRDPLAEAEIAATRKELELGREALDKVPFGELASELGKSRSEVKRGLIEAAEADEQRILNTYRVYTLADFAQGMDRHLSSSDYRLTSGEAANALTNPFGMAGYFHGPIELAPGKSVRLRLDFSTFCLRDMMANELVNCPVSVRLRIANRTGDHRLDDLQLAFPLCIPGHSGEGVAATRERLEVPVAAPGTSRNPTASTLTPNGTPSSSPQGVHASFPSAKSPMASQPLPVDDVARRCFDALRAEDPAAMTAAVRQWRRANPLDVPDCEAACRRVIERGRRLGIQWRAATLVSAREDRPGLRIEFTSDKQTFQVWLDNGTTRRDHTKSPAFVLGPALQYTDLRLNDCHPILHKELRWQVHADSKGEGLELWDVTAETKRWLTRDGGTFCFLSPTGEWVIYAAQTSGPQTYHLVHLNGERFDSGVAATIYSGTPQWSYDGRLCLVAEAHGTGMLSGTAGQTLVIDVENRRLIRPVIAGPGQKQRFQHRRLPIQWLPGHRKLCLDALPTLMSEPVSLIDVDNGTAHSLITNAKGIITSSDGAWIATCRADRESQTTRMIAVRTDGTKTLQVAAIPGDFLSGAPTPLGFSPDNRHLCYFRLTNPTGYYLVGLDGKLHVRLLPGDRYSPHACRWTTDSQTVLLRAEGIKIAPPHEHFLVERPADLLSMAVPDGWFFQVVVPAFGHWTGGPQPVIEPLPNGLVVTYTKGKVTQMHETVNLEPVEIVPTDAEGVRPLPTEYQPNPQLQLEVEAMKPKTLPRQSDAPP